MAIITISREFGSGGGNIARKLSNDLGYSFLDKDSLGEILTNYGFTRNKIDKYDEKRPPFWDIFTSDREKYLSYMKLAIFEFAREGSGIILGRGASILLRGLSGCLHVRIIAPPEKCREQVKKAYNINDQQAEQLIRTNHHDRAGFYKFFFDCAWDSPLLYDILINTGSFSEERAARIIEEEVRHLDSRENREESLSSLKDRYLGQKISTSLLFEKHLAVNFLSVEVSAGQLGGVPAVEECVKIPGVTEVENKIAVVTAYPVSYTPYY